MSYTVYIHRNKINNKAYVGQTNQKVENRWGKGSIYKPCVLFYRAIQKYGWDNFEHIVFVSGLTQKEADVMEKGLIALFNTTNPSLGYNIKQGGDNHSLSEETKKKISEAAKNRDDDWRRKQRESLLCSGINPEEVIPEPDRRSSSGKDSGRAVKTHCLPLQYPV